MAYIALEDIVDVWDDLDDRTWEALEEKANQRLSMAGTVDEASLNRLRDAAERNAGTPFPSTPEVLQDIVNRNT